MADGYCQIHDYSLVVVLRVRGHGQPLDYRICNILGSGNSVGRVVFSQDKKRKGGIIWEQSQHLYSYW